MLPADAPASIELSVDKSDWRLERPWRVNRKWSDDGGHRNVASEAAVPTSEPIDLEVAFLGPIAEPADWAANRRPWLINSLGEIVIGPRGSFHSDLADNDRARASGDIMDGVVRSYDDDQWTQRVQDAFDRLGAEKDADVGETDR